MSLCDRLSRVNPLPMMRPIIAKKARLTAASSKERSPVLFRTSAIALTAALALTACQRNPLKVTRNPCPAVAVPAYTGDVTLFSTPGATAADAIDTVATITNVRGGCSDDGSEFVTNVSFDVLARRNAAGAAESVTLPFFVAVVRGGDRLVAKQLGQVTVNFAEGQDRAQASGSAQSRVIRSAAILPADIQEKITRERRPGDEDAAIDPMTEPGVRDAVRNASFEVLVGFQLDQAQLAYNATK